MSHPRDPTPELDPYFVADGDDSKGGAKGGLSGGDEIRRDLLATEAAFRVAGTIGMVLGASVFALFAVPVSGMLRVAVEPGGVLLVEDWKWRRWVARMAAVLTLAVLATVTSWGLSRPRPWARWALIALGSVPPLASVAGIWLLVRAADPARRELGEVLMMPCVGAFVFPASIAAYRAAFSRRGRAVLSPDYEDVVARTPKLSPIPRSGLRSGLWLASAMLILYWTLLLTFLGVLAACGLIRTT